jgi:hypothetical protein
MKASTFLALLACLPLHAQAEDDAKFEVHEWGTITVLSGSDGIPLNWYQGWADADPLPPFVQINPAGSKAWPAQAAPVRMETPVIYFYPESPLRVSVSMSFKDGDLTEWFPTVKQLGAALSPPLPFIWEGDLSPPTDTKARGQIPEVRAGKGDHYRHAREVPDAWIFQSAAVPARSEKDPAKGKDADKFIFYRGKGKSTPPYRAQVGGDGRVVLSHLGYGGAIASAFMLTVEENSTQWAKMPRLDALAADKISLSSQAQSIVLPSTPRLDVDRAAEELTAEMHKALEAAGLTRDEARAMVATWSGHWFREPGTRVLAILPREWVDSVLPLKITPAPTKVERVFVARFEVLTLQRESEVLALLNDDADANMLGARLKELQLGRFGRGALARAQVMQGQHMAAKFELLQQAALKSPLECKTAAAQPRW